MSVQSQLSKATLHTQQLLESVSQHSSAQLLALQQDSVGGNTSLDSDQVKRSWEGLGVFISKQLRIGRAVNVPRLGIFTYTAPDFSLEGTTNQEKREHEAREPVYVVAAELAQNLGLHEAIVTPNAGLRPFSLGTKAGKVQTAQCNFAEIAQATQLSKDLVKLAIERILKRLRDSLRHAIASSSEEPVMLELPSVGVLLFKGTLAAMLFNPFLRERAKGLFKKHIIERKRDADSTLTLENIAQLTKLASTTDTAGNTDGLQLEDGARSWLSKNLAIHNYGVRSSESSIMIKNNNSKFQTPRKGTLSQSHSSHSMQRRSKSNVFVGGSKNLRSQFSLENLSMKKLKQELQLSRATGEEIFHDLVTIIYGINATHQSKLNREQFALALQKKRCNFYDFELDSLFNTIDVNGNGEIQLSEWLDVLCQEKSPEVIIREALKRENVSQMLNRMGIPYDAQPVGIVQLCEGFKRLNPELSVTEQRRAAKFCLKGADKVSVRDLSDLLRYSEGSGARRDFSEEEQRKQEALAAQISALHLKIRTALRERAITHGVYFLEQKFEEHDQNNQGIIDIDKFQQVLKRAALGLTADEIDKICRNIETNYLSQVDYQKFMQEVRRSGKLSQQQKQQNKPEAASAAQANGKVEEEDETILEDIALQIQRLLREKKIDTREFLLFLTENTQARKLFGVDAEERTRLPVQSFAKLLAHLLFSQSLRAQVLQNARLIDIDGDGFVDQYDVDVFLKRYSFLEEQKRASPLQQKAHQHQNHNNNHRYSQTDLTEITPKSTRSALFPTQTLSEHKMHEIMREVKQTLTRKKISLIEAFKLIDSDSDGFVTVSEFEVGIDKIVKLSARAKQALFAYLDNLKIGMFDSERFSSVMSRITLEKHQPIEDNFDWQNGVLAQWQFWFAEQGIDIDEAFRLADADFDGFLSKQDISQFLIKFLKVRSTDIDSAKIDRLFKLLDSYKRGFVQKTDLQKLLLPKNQKSLREFPSATTTTSLAMTHARQIQQLSARSFASKHLLTTVASLTSPNEFQKRSSSQTAIARPYEDEAVKNTNASVPSAQAWIENAKVQISIHLAKHFRSVKDSFEEISKHGSEIHFKEFEQYVHSKVALDGFNLTEKLLQRLFSELDPHKKGFLSESDWHKAFGNRQGATQVALQDVRENIQNTFRTAHAAFEFFTQGSDGLQGHAKILTLTGFKRGVRSLFNDLIYDTHQIESVWRLALEQLPNRNDSSSAQQITFNEFIHAFTPSLATADSEMTKSHLSKISQQSQRGILQLCTNITSLQHLYERISKLLIASGKDLNLAFENLDPTHTGLISTLEFKNLLMHLNLGLNSKDVQLLIMLHNPQNAAHLKYQDFLDKLRLNQSEQQILDRSENRIRALVDDLYHYLISPKDAFREFDQKKTGKMSFTDFRQFLINLSLLSKKKAPSFPVCQDMFDFIDLKKDGIIDLDEWVQSFARYEAPQQQLKTESSQLTGNGTHENQSVLHLLGGAIWEQRHSTPRAKGQRNSRSNLNPNDLYRVTTGISLKWESTSEYDRVIKLIGKNRKLLTELFKQAARGDENKYFNSALEEPKYLKPSTLRAILDTFLKKHGVHIEERNWNTLLGFAIRQQLIDFKFFLEIYKNREFAMDSHPVLESVAA